MFFAARLQEAPCDTMGQVADPHLERVHLGWNSSDAWWKKGYRSMVGECEHGVHLESDGVHIMRVYTYYCKISRGNFERHPQTLKWSPQIKCKFFGFHFKALGSQVKGLGYILRLWGSFQGFGFAIYSFGCHSRFFGLQFKVLRKLI